MPGPILPGVVESAKATTLSRNSSNTAQVLTAATEAVIAGATVPIPDTGLQKGAIYRVKLYIDKTAAGIATSAYKLGLIPASDVAAAVAAGGTPASAVTVANTDALLTFTKPAGTAAIDVGVVTLELTFVTIGAAVAEAGSVLGFFVMDHNLAATGHLQIPTSAQTAVDTSTATILRGQGGGYLVLTVTTGASDVSSVLYAEGQLELPPADSDDD